MAFMDVLTKEELNTLLSDIPDFDISEMSKELAKADMSVPIEEELKEIEKEYIALTRPKKKKSNLPEKKVQLLSDITLELRVELGKTSITLKDILSLNQGTIINLERHSDEPLDLMASKSPIAKGEVIIIDETFGLRVTEMMDPEDYFNFETNIK